MLREGAAAATALASFPVALADLCPLVLVDHAVSVGVETLKPASAAGLAHRVALRLVELAVAVGVELFEKRLVTLVVTLKTTVPVLAVTLLGPSPAYRRPFVAVERSVAVEVELFDQPGPPIGSVAIARGVRIFDRPGRDGCGESDEECEG